ncbi:hypothetical protein [Bacillus thuringiensis]|nr:hypothetical protein [Bacillus thuringiensis]
MALGVKKEGEWITNYYLGKASTEIIKKHNVIGIGDLLVSIQKMK